MVIILHSTCEDFFLKRGCMPFSDTNSVMSSLIINCINFLIFIYKIYLLIINCNIILIIIYKNICCERDFID
jgi:hypothetical protein